MENAMASDESTIIASKTQFLGAQVRILSQPLKASEKWKDGAAFPEGELRDVMRAANQILRRHNNTVYDRIAMRNCAKQIESLYWEEGAPDLSDEDDEDDDDIVRRGEDLTTDASLTKLTTMATEPNIPAPFRSRVKQLQKLASQRAAAQKKLNALRDFQKLIEPIRNAGETVQPNLVTRDGALAEELARSRRLGIRVAGRVAGLRGGDLEGVGEDGDGHVVMVDEGEKVRRVLGG
ncbi:hypothetical protein EJ08DRAFT_638083 [Tothia fuscella]|uniref:Kinetochore protein fta4 n=1 Tax=Tothia fuscella TaxID=1048955 RepID=A0A9P4NLI1_9PEZI|nr:hypothetical protein EJ08DRAFT_638083 [Tothia fuscella]